MLIGPSTPHDFVALAGRAAIEPARHRRPIGLSRARLGFPSPAEDYQADALDLNELLIRNEPATFFYRAAGHSMRAAGILDGDYLAVDRSESVKDGDIVVAVWDGNEPVCKFLRLCGDHVELHSAHSRYTPIVLAPETVVEAFFVCGVVRSMRHARPR